MSYRMDVTRSTWNGRGLSNASTRKVVQEPDHNPKCRCGGMFPLDEHPRTGERCCSSCYMDGRESLLNDLQIDHIVFRQTRSVRASTRVDLVHATRQGESK